MVHTWSCSCASKFQQQGHNRSVEFASKEGDQTSPLPVLFVRRSTFTPPPRRRADAQTPNQQQHPQQQPAYGQDPQNSSASPWPQPAHGRPQPTWPQKGPPEWHPAPHRSPSPSTSRAPTLTAPPPPPQRSQAETLELKAKLYDIFPEQKQRIDRILSDNPYMRDLNALSGLLLG